MSFHSTDSPLIERGGETGTRIHNRGALVYNSHIDTFVSSGFVCLAAATGRLLRRTFSWVNKMENICWDKFVHVHSRSTKTKISGIWLGSKYLNSIHWQDVLQTHFIVAYGN